MMIVLIVVLGLTGFTIYIASSSVNPGKVQMNGMYGKGERGEMPTDENGQIEKREMPTGENGQVEKREMPTDENGQIEKREMPTDENGEAISPRGGNFGEGRKMQKRGSGIATSYLILFGIEGIIIGFIVIYWIVTKFNKKGVKETLKNKKKVAVIIVGTLVLAAGITAGAGAISNNVARNNLPQQNFNRENNPMNHNADTDVEQSTNGSI